MRIAVFGATGYGGMEALRFLASHATAEVAWIGSDSHAGRRVGELLPAFARLPVGELRFSPLSSAVDLPDVDAALLAMPHGEANKFVPSLLAQGVRVVDFSGDFRLPAEEYESWYGRPGIVDRLGAVYGLPEVFREDIQSARLVANPGCHATVAELALLPLIENDLAADSNIYIDSKSGVSGAGRSPKQETHFVETAGSVRAYRVGNHQHTPEIEQTLREARRRRGRPGDAGVTVLLGTQVLPMKRGIYVSACVPLNPEVSSAEALQEVYETRYAEEPFVRVLPAGQPPETRYVSGTNECHIGVHYDPRTRLALVFAAIDNLGKGAAGQALQNLNLMLGLKETEGLATVSIW